MMTLNEFKNDIISLGFEMKIYMRFVSIFDNQHTIIIDGDVGTPYNYTITFIKGKMINKFIIDINKNECLYFFYSEFINFFR